MLGFIKFSPTSNRTKFSAPLFNFRGKYYNMFEHLNSEIENAKNKIQFLRETQYVIFEDLSKRLNVSPLGHDWLFDYVYNTDSSRGPTFDDYIRKFSTADKELLVINPLTENAIPLTSDEK